MHKADFGKYYNNYKEIYQRPENYFDSLAGQIITLLKKENVSILDIGCGFGNFLNSFYKILGEGNEYVGLTLASHEAEQIKNNFPFIKVIVGNQQDLSKLFGSRKFDIILNFCTLSYSKQKNQPEIIFQISQILKNGGIMVVAFIDDWVSLKKGIRQSGEGYVQFFYSPNIFIALARENTLIKLFKKDNYRVQIWKKNDLGDKITGLKLYLFYFLRNNIFHWDIVVKVIKKYGMETSKSSNY